MAQSTLAQNMHWKNNHRNNLTLDWGSLSTCRVRNNMIETYWNCLPIHFRLSWSQLLHICGFLEYNTKSIRSHRSHIDHILQKRPGTFSQHILTKYGLSEVSLLFFAVFFWAPCLRIGVAQRAHVKQTHQNWIQRLSITARSIAWATRAQCLSCHVHGELEGSHSNQFFGEKLAFGVSQPKKYASIMMEQWNAWKSGPLISAKLCQAASWLALSRNSWMPATSDCMVSNYLPEKDVNPCAWNVLVLSYMSGPPHAALECFHRMHLLKSEPSLLLHSNMEHLTRHCTPSKD